MAQLDRVHHPAVPPLHRLQQLVKLLHLPDETPGTARPEAAPATRRRPGDFLVIKTVGRAATFGADDWKLMKHKLNSNSKNI